MEANPSTVGVDERETDRCRVCGVALAGPLALVSLVLGVRRSSRNPNLCNRCSAHLRDGVEVEVTVLFADLAAFTALTQELGPAETHAIVDAFLRRATAIVQRHDGMVDKYIGDAVMVIFNAPIRRADHRRAALAAALEILAATVELGREHGRSLQANAGLASGLVRLGRLGSDDMRSFTALGDPVNLASRLEDLAEGGEVVVDASIYADVAGDLPGIQPRTVVVRGVTDPVMIASVPGGTPHRLVDGQAAPMIRPRLGTLAVVAAALGAPCAGFYLFSPLVVALGYGAIFESAAVLAVDFFFDDGPARITLALVALASAAAAVLTVARARWRRRRQTGSAAPLRGIEAAQERRLIALGGLAVLIVVFEHVVHLVYEKGFFSAM